MIITSHGINYSGAWYNSYTIGYKRAALEEIHPIPRSSLDREIGQIFQNITDLEKRWARDWVVLLDQSDEDRNKRLLKRFVQALNGSQAIVANRSFIIRLLKHAEVGAYYYDGAELLKANWAVATSPKRSLVYLFPNKTPILSLAGEKNVFLAGHGSPCRLRDGKSSFVVATLWPAQLQELISHLHEMNTQALAITSCNIGMLVPDEVFKQAPPFFTVVHSLTDQMTKLSLSFSFFEYFNLLTQIVKTADLNARRTFGRLVTSLGRMHEEPQWAPLGGRFRVFNAWRRLSQVTARRVETRKKVLVCLRRAICCYIREIPRTVIVKHREPKLLSLVSGGTNVYIRKMIFQKLTVQEAILFAIGAPDLSFGYQSKSRMLKPRELWRKQQSFSIGSLKGTDETWKHVLVMLPYRTSDNVLKGNIAIAQTPKGWIRWKLIQPVEGIDPSKPQYHYNLNYDMALDIESETNEARVMPREIA